jgi:hypothetical protein
MTPEERRGPAREDQPSFDDHQAAATKPLDASSVSAEAWRRAAYAALAALARFGDEFVCDDIVALVGRQPHHRKQLGSVLGAAARYGQIVAVGATFGASGRLIRIWRGAS